MSTIFPPNKPKTSGTLQSQLHKKSTAERSDKPDPLKLWRTTVCFKLVCWTGCPGNPVWFHYGLDKHNPESLSTFNSQREVSHNDGSNLLHNIWCVFQCMSYPQCVCLSPCMSVLERHKEIENSAAHEKVAKAALLESDKNQQHYLQHGVFGVCVVTWGQHLRETRIKTQRVVLLVTSRGSWRVQSKKALGSADAL